MKRYIALKTELPSTLPSVGDFLTDCDDPDDAFFAIAAHNGDGFPVTEPDSKSYLVYDRVEGKLLVGNAYSCSEKALPDRIINEFRKSFT